MRTGRALIGFVLGVVAVSGLAACQSAPVAVWTPQVVFHTTPVPWSAPSADKVSTPFRCLGLDQDDFAAVLEPGTDIDDYYLVTVSRCIVSRSSFGIAIDTGWQAGKVLLPPVDQINSDWMPNLAYRFPDSFGWGGALFVDGSVDSFPAVAASSDAAVLAFLCVDDTGSQCMGAQVFPAGSPFLLPNVNGVRDPVGVAVGLLGTSWQRLSAQGSPYVPIQVPSVNPAPYVPSTIPIPDAASSPGSAESPS
ncbi:MAG: hypothetical protein FWF36_09495 [Propionibacteriaceae bacterium]|nr:hypothetical protein [Propionibacteriaceae bacterium]